MADAEDTDEEKAPSENSNHRKERKRGFLSLARLRRKSKSKSLTDLNNDGEEKTPTNGSVKLKEEASDNNNGSRLKKQTTFDIVDNSGGSIDSQFLNTTFEDDELESEEFSFNGEVFEDLPPGTTAGTLWKSGLCSFFALDLELKEGIGLIARDKSGTSDPYVKVKLTGKCVFKSRVIRKNLNPVWNEKFSVAVDDINTNLLLKVYDFDLVTSDDQMGVASIPLGDIEVGRTMDIKVDLINQSGLREDLGQLSLSILLTPKTPNERVEASDVFLLGNGQSEHLCIPRPTIKASVSMPNIDVMCQSRSATEVAGSAEDDTIHPKEEKEEEEKTEEEHDQMKKDRDARSEKYLHYRNFTKWMTSRHYKQASRSQVWHALLSVVLVEGKKLIPMDDNGFSDPYCRIKLGNEKYKTKTCKATLNPQWREHFDMKIYADTPMLLEISVWDKDPGKDEFMGRCQIDLSDTEREKTHFIERDLEDKAGTLSFYLTITALATPNSVSDLSAYVEDPQHRMEIENQFCLARTLKNVNEVGWVQVKIHRAVGLAVADLSGTSDPFVIMELNNQRVVTPTIYKTLNPKWEKLYELPVNDIHDVLDITLYDEDKRGAPEFLGRVVIPLLTIVPQEKRLYQLKDKRLQVPAKGHIILTLDLVYNPIRASMRTFNPRKENVLYEAPRFRRQLLQRNVDRLTNVLKSIVVTGQFIQSLFTWKYRLRSAFAFVLYILLVLNFDWFLLPLILLLILLKNYVVFMLHPDKHTTSDEHEHLSPYHDEDEEDEDIADDKNRKTKSKSFREKLEAVTTICTQVQNELDFIASFGERIKNTFNWSVPFCSYLLMVILIVGTIVLYLIPMRYLLLAWGINKFTKRIRKPNSSGNNEALDFLSRLPSDPEVKQRRPLKNDVVLR